MINNQLDIGAVSKNRAFTVKFSKLIQNLKNQRIEAVVQGEDSTFQTTYATQLLF